MATHPEPTKPRRLFLLGAIFFAIAFYLYFFEFRGPCKEEARKFSTSIQALQEQIGSKSQELRKIQIANLPSNQDLQEEAASERILPTIPDAPLVYYPVRIASIFKQYQLQPPHPVLNMLLPFESTKVLGRQNWKLAVADVDTLKLGGAMAELENHYPLLQITFFSLRSNPEKTGLEAEMTLQFVVLQ